MNNPDIQVSIDFTDNGKLIKKETNPIIVKYNELNRSYGMKLNAKKIESNSEILSKSEVRKNLYKQHIVLETKDELSKFGYSDIEIVDVLVKYLYCIKNNKHKDLLWDCYGDIIYNNLSKHLREDFKDMECVDCGKWFRVTKFDSATCRCMDCATEYKREQTRLRVKKHREKNKK